MWHEARRHEKATQKLFSDHRRRAERRREANRVDPSSLLQVHGIKSKIHLDLNTHKQAAKSLIVWQGDQTTTIDRFDVRATLNSLPKEANASVGQKPRPTVVDASENELMRKMLNYERYRLLVQNDFHRVPETTRLKLVGQSELFSETKMMKSRNDWLGTSGESSAPQHQKAQNRHQMQQTRSQGVSIGYNYNQAPPPPPPGEQFDAIPDISTAAATREPLLKNVIDLDDFEKFDLDHVDRSSRGSKRTEEVTLKYGIACDEFHLLLEHDEANNSTAPPTTTKELLHRLQRLHKQNRLNNAKAAAAAPTRKPDATFYGPALPPEMIQDADNNTPSCSSNGSSPIQQRSPSGAFIPLRAARASNVVGASPGDERAPDNNCDKNSHTDTCEVRDQVETKQRPEPKADQVDGVPNHCKEDERGDEARRAASPKDSRRPRRAATPLAYKRYRRSSRSLSRERRRSSSSRARHRKRGSRSRSSSRDSRGSYYSRKRR